jgi:hypothetical protein
MERWDDAETHFEEALAMNFRLGARPFVAHTQHEYAEMLLARGGDQDPQRVARLLRDGVSTAGELGMESLVRQIGAIEG